MNHSAPACFTSCYFPPREWMHLFAASESPVIVNGKWHKQSLRNRTFILSPNGIQRLTVPVKSTGGLPAADRDIRIDYSMPWIRLHLGALRAAYNTSPFYGFLCDELEAILERKEIFLFDLNQHLLELLLQKIKRKSNYQIIENPGNGYTDFRQIATLKSTKNIILSDLNSKVYQQVFSYKFPFSPALSVLDEICNTGMISLDGE